MLLKSCATPPASWLTASSFAACARCASSSRILVTSWWTPIIIVTAPDASRTGTTDDSSRSGRPARVRGRIPVDRARDDLAELAEQPPDDVAPRDAHRPLERRVHVGDQPDRIADQEHLRGLLERGSQPVALLHGRPIVIARDRLVGDVDHHPGQVARAVGVVDDPQAVAEPAVRAVGHAPAVLVWLGLAPLDGLVHDANHAGAVVGMDAVLPELADAQPVLRLVAGDLAQAVGDVQ